MIFRLFRRVGTVPALKQMIGLMAMIKRIHIAVISLCALLFAIIGLAQEREVVVVAELGPQIGERVPDFELRDQFGQIQTLDSIMGPNGAMLLFHRSADW